MKRIGRNREQAEGMFQQTLLGPISTQDIVLNNFKGPSISRERSLLRSFSEKYVIWGHALFLQCRRPRLQCRRICLQCREFLQCRESTCNAGDPGSIPGLGRSSGEGIDYPLHYSWASPVAQLVKNLLQCRRPGFDPCVRKIPWRKERLPTPVSWSGEFHGQYIHGVTKSQTWQSDFHFYLMNLFIFLTNGWIFFYPRDTAWIQQKYSYCIQWIKKICSPCKWFIITKIILNMKKKYFHYYKM